VASAGDVNGDGYSDVIVGNAVSGESDEGAVFVYHGSAVGLSAAVDWSGESDQGNSDFGDAVASAGDVNGDGFSDIMVGAYHWDFTEEDEGLVFLYYGNSRIGLARAPMQWQNDYDNPIAPLGWSEEETRIALRGVARTAAGRGKVRIAYEIKEALDPFDGTGIEDGYWWDTGAPADPGGSRVTIFRHVSGLTAGRYYHWRLRFESKNPYFPRTHWLHLAGNAPGEADVRTAGGGSDIADLVVETGTRLLACSPNPCVQGTQVRYALGTEGPVRITMHDVQGRQVALLVDEARHAPGTYSVDWNGRGASKRRVPAGIYFCRLESGGSTATTRVLVAH
jgi:hypothetical protein